MNGASCPTYGDFITHACLGSGGSAVVLGATHRVLPGDFALKVWHRPLTLDQRHRFEEELKAQWSLADEPHVVRLHWGEAPTDGPAWIAMERYDMSLLERCRLEPPLTRDELMTIATDVLHGLASIHRKGFLHRDVKPANVLLKNGRAALGDLGLAMVFGEDTQHDAAGTTNFLAPELGAGVKPNPRSDVYSAARTIEFLGSEQLPIQAQKVVIRAASHSPDDRPADGGAFHLAFTQALSSRESDTEDEANNHVGVGERRWPWWEPRHRSRRVAGLGAAAIVLTVGALGFQSVSGGKASPDPSPGTASPRPAATRTLSDSRRIIDLAAVPEQDEPIGETLLESDFAEKPSSWPTRAAPHLAARFIAGTYETTMLEKGKFAHIRAPIAATPNDIVVSATGAITEGQGAWGLWCRGGPNDGENYLFQLSHAGAVRITDATEEGTGWYYLDGIRPSDPNTLSARCADTAMGEGPVTLTLSVNRRQVLTYHPRKLLGPGPVGLVEMTFGDVTGPMIHTRFKRFSVVKPSTLMVES